MGLRGPGVGVVAGLLWALPVVAAPSLPVVALVRGTHAECSGLLFAPDRVLTAAHCLDTDPAALRVHAGTDPLAPVAVVQLLAVAPHPLYDRLHKIRDVAVVVLARPVTETAAWSGSVRAPVVGETVQFVGFGHTGPDGHDAHARHAGNAKVTAVDGLRAKLAGAPNLPCAGDSGAPVLAAGQPARLLGLVVAGIETCGDYALAEVLDPATAAWAEIAVAEAVSAQPTGAAGRADDGGCSAGQGGAGFGWALAVFGLMVACWTVAVSGPVSRPEPALTRTSPF